MKQEKGGGRRWGRRVKYLSICQILFSTLSKTAFINIFFYTTNYATLRTCKCHYLHLSKSTHHFFLKNNILLIFFYSTIQFQVVKNAFVFKLLNFITLLAFIFLRIQTHSKRNLDFFCFNTFALIFWIFWRKDVIEGFLLESFFTNPRSRDFDQNCFTAYLISIFVICRILAVLNNLENRASLVKLLGDYFLNPHLILN